MMSNHVFFYIFNFIKRNKIILIFIYLIAINCDPVRILTIENNIDKKKKCCNLWK